MGSSVDRELDLEESHGRIAVVNDDENIRKQEEESFCTALQLVEIVAQIATENPEAPVMLDGILRFLASYSVLDCSVVAANDEFVRFYSLNRVSKHFMPNEDGVSLAPMVALGHDKVPTENAIAEGGRPFKRAHGLHLFEYTGSDPRFHQAFHTAMFNYAIIVMKKIVQIYKGFEQLNKLVDVGGGLGHTLNLIISKYPHIKGINYDMPQVIKHVSPYPGVECVGGDMFGSVPKGDAIIMKWILHDWTDAQCLKLLKNCYNAIPNDGKVNHY
ncbi:hypothetical protein ACFX12_000932 [Malus domestica]